MDTRTIGFGKSASMPHILGEDKAQKPEGSAPLSAAPSPPDSPATAFLNELGQELPEHWFRMDSDTDEAVRKAPFLPGLYATAGPLDGGHERRITDPFVESSAPSPFVAQVKQKVEPFSASQVPYPGTYTFQASPSYTTRNNHGTAHAHGFHSLGTSAYQAHQPTNSTTSSTQSFMAGPSRPNMPNPSPLFSSARGKAEARARLDAQAAINAEWVRTEAKKIADLSRLSFQAYTRYQFSGAQEDYETWQRLLAEYNDATNLEKRQEERRNLHKPKSMRAANTSGEKEQTEAEDTEITPDLLDILTADEKRELKKQLVALARIRAPRRTH
jgi:hypothetical protein